MATIAVGIAGTTFVAALIGSYGARLAWWLDLLTHGRLLLAIGLLICVLLHMVLRCRRLAAAWAAGAVLAAIPLLPYWVSGQFVAPATPLVELVHANLGQDDLRVGLFVDWVEFEQPAVLSLQEVTPATLTSLRQKLGGYRLVASRAREDTRGVAVFVADDATIAVDARVIDLLVEFDRPMVEAVFTTQEGQEIAFLGFHTTRPTSNALHDSQRHMMEAAADWAVSQQTLKRDAFVIGDFNSTGQSVLVSRMCELAQLADLRHGNGWRGTWPAGAPAFCRLPIDGGFATSGVRARSVRVGPDVGSDHRPVIYELWVKGGAPAAEINAAAQTAGTEIGLHAKPRLTPAAPPGSPAIP